MASGAGKISVPYVFRKRRRNRGDTKKISVAKFCSFFGEIQIHPRLDRNFVRHFNSHISRNRDLIV